MEHNILPRTGYLLNYYRHQAINSLWHFISSSVRSTKKGVPALTARYCITMRPREMNFRLTGIFIVQFMSQQCLVQQIEILKTSAAHSAAYWHWPYLPRPKRRMVKQAPCLSNAPEAHYVHDAGKRLVRHTSYLDYKWLLVSCNNNLLLLLRAPDYSQDFNLFTLPQDEVLRFHPQHHHFPGRRRLRQRLYCTRMVNGQPKPVCSLRLPTRRLEALQHQRRVQQSFHREPWRLEWACGYDLCAA